jgi:UDP-2,4-diacetamido-2,4,6-trideoxy-beta-L-altropyranose hydrolase
MKRLIIRADASPQIGAGHIMRCLALAQTWQDGGGHVAFLSCCESAALRQRITGEGFELIPLQNSHPHREDLRNTLEYLEHSAAHAVSATAAWVVLDGYHFGATYQKALKQAGARLLCIDDYGHAAHYSADLVLNQNISANEALYPNREPYTRLLLGTHYVMLRREFRSWRGWKRTIPEVARKVLVTMGGGDPDNVTLKVVEALKVIADPQLEIQIVVGPENPNLDILESALLSAPRPMRLLKDVTDMPALMSWADIAISAGGSTCWELCKVGIPFVTIILAENQAPIAEGLAFTGVSINLGWYNSISIEAIARQFSEFVCNWAQRTHMAHLGRSLVDGAGCKRVVDTLWRS